MQGIIILGGLGSRLNLFSKRVSNKALALVYNRLVFEYPLNTLVRAGITNIVLVTGARYAGILLNVIGDGGEFQVESLKYVYQKDPLGISQAISLAEGMVTEKCAVILGDNFFEEDITPYVDAFKKQDKGCQLFLKEVSDPKRFGVADIEKRNNQTIIKDIIEKPKNPPSNLAVTGLYFYDQTLFEKIRKLKPSARGELEVTDLNRLYVEEGTCQGHVIKSYWNDMGTYDSLLDTANFVKNNNFELTYEIDAWKTS